MSSCRGLVHLPMAVAVWSSGQDSGELFKEFGFEPGLRTFRMLIATIFCNVIGKLRGFRTSFVTYIDPLNSKHPIAPENTWALIMFKHIYLYTKKNYITRSCDITFAYYFCLYNLRITLTAQF
jgi:hypothetical protein